MKGLRVLTAEKVRIDDKGEIERNGYFCDGDEIEEINMSRYRIVQELLLGYPPYNKLIYLDDVHYLVLVEPIQQEPSLWRTSTSPKVPSPPAVTPETRKGLKGFRGRFIIRKIQQG